MNLRLCLTVTHMRKIKLAGIRRSGNHAVLGWVAEKSIGGKTFFLNDVVLGRDYTTKRKSDNLPTNKLCRRGKASLFLSSYEDKSLSEFDNHEPLKNIPHTEETKVILLRDPFNTFASRLKCIRSRRDNKYMQRLLNDEPSLLVGDMPRISNLWKSYAKEYLGETNTLQGRVLFLNYNMWTQDCGYRVELAKALGLAEDGKPFERVPGYGFGSSFDNRKKDGKATEMDLANRWEVYREDEDYLNYFDGELIDLSNEIFSGIGNPLA